MILKFMIYVNVLMKLLTFLTPYFNEKEYVKCSIS